MPMVIEIVSAETRIEAFRPILAEMIEETGRGAMVTMENIRVVHYKPGQK